MGKNQMILVTGGTGFLGSHLLARLVQANQKIYATKRVSSSLKITQEIFSFYFTNWQEYFSKIAWIDVDLNSFEEVYSALADVDFVYHCAASVSFNPVDYGTLMNSNASVTANMVNACIERKIAKMCYVSSVAALGPANGKMAIDENCHWQSTGYHSGYSVSKHFAEMEVWRGIEEGLCAVIVNPSVILGPGNWNKGSSRFFTEIKKGLPLCIPGETGFVDVRDVCSAMVQLMSSSISAERFVLNSENLAYPSLFKSIAAALNGKPPKWIAGNALLQIAWRVEKIRCLFSGNDPVITRDTAQSAIRKNQYSASKIVEALNFRFTPINETLNYTAGCFTYKW